MTTFTKNLQTETELFAAVNTSVTRPNVKQLSVYDRFIESIKFSHFGVIAMAILFGSCLGSIATMKVFENNAPLWQFVLSLAVTMANLVACISQAPTKWVVNLFSLSVVVNVILLLLNII